MPRWMISCKEHSRLASEGMDHALTFWERLSIRIHQWVCPACARVQCQFRAIRAACRRVPADDQWDQPAGIDTSVLPEDACRQIKAILREQIGKIKDRGMNCGR